MKPDFSPQSLLWGGNNGTFFSPCVSLPQFFPASYHPESVSGQILIEGLINRFVQRRPAPVLMVRGLFILTRHRIPSTTCLKNKHAFAAKKIWMKRKIWMRRKIETWDTGPWKRRLDAKLKEQFRESQKCFFLGFECQWEPQRHQKFEEVLLYVRLLAPRTFSQQRYSQKNSCWFHPHTL